MRAHIELFQGHPIACNNLAQYITALMHEMGITGSAGWYYDEFDNRGTIYGVKLDTTNLSKDQLLMFLYHTTQNVFADYGEFAIVLPQD